MVVASAAALDRDEPVVVAAVLVDEGDDAGYRLTHVRVMMLEVLACLVYLSARDVFSIHLEADSPTIWLRFYSSNDLLVVIIKRGRLPPTESAIMVPLLSGLLTYDTSRVIA